LARALDLARILDRELARTIAPAPDAHHHVHTLATELVDVLGLASARARDLAMGEAVLFDSQLNRHLGRAHDVARAVTRDVALAHDLGRYDHLACALSLARTVSAVLDDVRRLVAAGYVTGGQGRSRATRAARRMTCWSVRMLPPAMQPRYREELAAELIELRDQPRQRQLGYALRLLVQSVNLRRTLRQAPAMAPARELRR